MSFQIDKAFAEQLYLDAYKAALEEFYGPEGDPIREFLKWRERQGDVSSPMELIKTVNTFLHEIRTAPHVINSEDEAKSIMAVIISDPIDEAFRDYLSIADRNKYAALLKALNEELERLTNSFFYKILPKRMWSTAGGLLYRDQAVAAAAAPAAADDDDEVADVVDVAADKKVKNFKRVQQILQTIEVVKLLKERVMTLRSKINLLHKESEKIYMAARVLGVARAAEYTRIPLLCRIGRSVEEMQQYVQLDQRTSEQKDSVADKLYETRVVAIAAAARPQDSEPEESEDEAAAASRAPQADADDELAGGQLLVDEDGDGRVSRAESASVAGPMLTVHLPSAGSFTNEEEFAAGSFAGLRIPAVSFTGSEGPDAPQQAVAANSSAGEANTGGGGLRRAFALRGARGALPAAGGFEQKQFVVVPSRYTRAATLGSLWNLADRVLQSLRTQIKDGGPELTPVGSKCPDQLRALSLKRFVEYLAKGMEQEDQENDALTHKLQLDDQDIHALSFAIRLYVRLDRKSPLYLGLRDFLQYHLSPTSFHRIDRVNQYYDSPATRESLEQYIREAMSGVMAERLASDQGLDQARTSNLRLLGDTLLVAGDYVARHPTRTPLHSHQVRCFTIVNNTNTLRVPLTPEAVEGLKNGVFEGVRRNGELLSGTSDGLNPGLNALAVMPGVAQSSAVAARDAAPPRSPPTLAGAAAAAASGGEKTYDFSRQPDINYANQDPSRYFEEGIVRLIAPFKLEKFFDVNFFNNFSDSMQIFKNIEDKVSSVEKRAARSLLQVMTDETVKSQLLACEERNQRVLLFWVTAIANANSDKTRFFAFGETQLVVQNDDATRQAATRLIVLAMQAHVAKLEGYLGSQDELNSAMRHFLQTDPIVKSVMAPQDNEPEISPPYSPGGGFGGGGGGGGGAAAFVNQSPPPPRPARLGRDVPVVGTKPPLPPRRPHPIAGPQAAADASQLTQGPTGRDVRHISDLLGGRGSDLLWDELDGGAGLGGPSRPEQAQRPNWGDLFGDGTPAAAVAPPPPLAPPPAPPMLPETLLRINRIFVQVRSTCATPVDSDPLDVSSGAAAAPAPGPSPQDALAQIFSEALPNVDTTTTEGKAAQVLISTINFMRANKAVYQDVDHLIYAFWTKCAETLGTWDDIGLDAKKQVAICLKPTALREVKKCYPDIKDDSEAIVALNAAFDSIIDAKQSPRPGSR